MKLHHFAVIIILFLTLPLFFYKLGQTSLVSWDEAWYAEVARNIVKTGDPINMVWNGQPYFDHPPTGYVLMALTYKIFGINEFWTRFPSAASGAISIILLYLLGKRLFNPLVGFSAAVALTSATWFIFRARSGNLDIILTMFFLLTLLLAIIAQENERVLSFGNRRFLIPLAISLSLLFLTKTMVPLAIIPSLIVIFHNNERVLSFGNKLYKGRDLILPALIFFTIVIGWFMTQINQFSAFIGNYLGVGLRGASVESSYISNLILTKDYLYNGLGRWFWPTILFLTLSITLKQKRFLILIVFFISFILPTIFSPKIQIWHLIPLYPILLLAFFGFAFTFSEKYFHRWKFQIYAIVLIFSSIIYFNQVRMMWYQFIDIPPFISDEATLSMEASKYPYKLIVDGEYRPSALFYSEKGTITQAPKGREDFAGLLNGNEEFLLITNKWRLDDPEISKKEYQILKEDRDKVLILHNRSKI